MQPLDQILALTESVERHVERGEWAEAGALDAERCRLLAELCADPGCDADRAAARAVLQDLLIRNQRTIATVEARKQALARDSAALGRAGGAVSAYARNAGSERRAYLREVTVNEP